MLELLGITNAYADTAAGPAAGGGNILSLLPMLAILVVFMYFMVIRPQSKRAKDQRNLIASIKKGDEVATIGGILGRVEKVENDFMTLEIADGVNIIVQKNAVATCLPKGTMNSKGA